MSTKPKIIILGAGMSGIACALSLYKNFDVQIYEKSRGMGGRLCAKRLPEGVFHFGAQFCTARTTSFQNFLSDSNAINFLGSCFDVDIGSNIESENYFVGRDGMHSLLKKYDEVLNIHYNHKAIDLDEKRKLISFDSGQKISYDIIISSLPLPQAREIFQTEIEHDAILALVYLLECQLMEIIFMSIMHIKISTKMWHGLDQVVFTIVKIKKPGFYNFHQKLA
jgi:predicted NAD/FAD-dependent oxidoreductase